MPLITGVGWRKFLTQDTRIKCVTNSLRAQAENNVTDCEDNPALQAELYTRCRAAIQGLRDGTNEGLGALPGFTNVGRQVAPFVYEEEPTDEWKTFAMMAEDMAGRTIRADCDCLSPIWAAFFWLRWDKAVPVGVGISQPKTRPCRCREHKQPCKGRRCTPEGPLCASCGYGMAHAYTVLGTQELPERARAALSPFLVSMPGQPGVAVWDGSVHAGMPRPRDSFYGSGETSLKWLRQEVNDG